MSNIAKDLVDLAACPHPIAKTQSSYCCQLSAMAMQKGFFGATGPALSSATGGSSKKKKEPKRPKGGKPSAADIFATPGVAKPKRDCLDYSRFDQIGAKEQRQYEREQKLKQVPASVRGRLGRDGEDMVLDMAEKMREDPSLRPTPETIKEQLNKERLHSAASARTTAAKSSHVPTRPTGPVGSVSSRIESTRDDFVSQARDAPT